MLASVIRFYRDGLRGMTLGRSLWLIVLLKLLIMFGVLKLIFFPSFLGARFASDAERGSYVLDQIAPPADPAIEPEMGNSDD